MKIGRNIPVPACMPSGAVARVSHRISALLGCGFVPEQTPRQGAGAKLLIWEVSPGSSDGGVGKRQGRRRPTEGTSRSR